MESNGRKRRGFMKGKLMPFYRAAKPNSSTSLQYMTNSNKVMKQSQSAAPTVGYLVHQDYAVAQPKPKVSFILPDSLVQLESLYGVAVDEGVDSKAANYITSVQERFKLEPVNSERSSIKCQDIRT